MTSGPKGVNAGQDSIATDEPDTFYRDLQDAHPRPLWLLGPDRGGERRVLCTRIRHLGEMQLRVR